MKDSLNIAIAGATGYAGLELIKILSKHPKAKLLYLCATKSIGKSINKFDKGLKKYNLPKISKIDKINWSKIDILFTALYVTDFINVFSIKLSFSNIALIFTLIIILYD